MFGISAIHVLISVYALNVIDHEIPYIRNTSFMTLMSQLSTKMIHPLQGLYIAPVAHTVEALQIVQIVRHRRNRMRIEILQGK